MTVDWRPRIVQRTSDQSPSPLYVVTVWLTHNGEGVPALGQGSPGAEFPTAEAAVTFVEVELTRLFKPGHVIDFDNVQHADLESAMKAIKAKPLAEDPDSPGWLS